MLEHISDTSASPGRACILFLALGNRNPEDDLYF